MSVVQWLPVERLAREVKDVDPEVVKDQVERAGKLDAVDPELAKVISGSGLQDGSATDDVVKVSKANVPASKLKPSQTTIKLWGVIGIALQMIRTGKIGGDLGAVVSSDHYIMDGHHRWAAAILAGGKSVKVGVFQADEKGQDLIKVLNILTKGFFGRNKGNSGTGSLNDVSPAKVKAQLEEYLKDGIKGEYPVSAESVRDTLIKGFGTVEEGVKKMSENAKLVHKDVPSWAPSREQMPVIEPEEVPSVANALGKGEVNWKVPYTSKKARANVVPVRQRTQYSCMAASMAMCLRALEFDRDEDEVNRVLGALPLQGAAWEQALATAQYYGCRATLVVPSTVAQLKEWTDQGIPVMIAWNPEGRDWSHASVVFDVDADGNVYVADPNIPDPDETVRVVSKADFYAKWYEKWPKYLVRRPAMAISREVTPDGRQARVASDVEEAKPKTDERKQKVLDSLSRIRGKEREEYFENGGSATGWRGGPSSVTKDKTKYERREKHQKDYRSMSSSVAGRHLEGSSNRRFAAEYRTQINPLGEEINWRFDLSTMNQPPGKIKLHCTYGARGALGNNWSGVFDIEDVKGITSKIRSQYEGKIEGVDEDLIARHIRTMGQYTAERELSTKRVPVDDKFSAFIEKFVSDYKNFLKKGGLDTPFEEALRLAENVLTQWAEGKWGSADRVARALEKADRSGDLSQVVDYMTSAWREIEPASRRRMKRDFDRFWAASSSR